jgi:MFS family permease
MLLFMRYFKWVKSKALIYGTKGFWFLLDGVFVNAAAILTTGAFLSGLFVHLKAPDNIVGIVNTANVWTTVCALASFFIFNKIKKTKRFLILLNITARTLICSIAALPLFLGEGGATVGIATFMVIAGNIIWSIYAVGGNIWMIATIPRVDRSSFIYMRSLWLRISFALTSVVMGFILDSFNGKLIGFTLVFAISFLFSIVDILVLVKIPYTSGKDKGVSTMSPSLLLAPVKDKVFRNFLIFTFLFLMAIYSSGSFTSLYLIKYMGFSYKFISITTVLTHCTMILSTIFWKNFERHRGIVFAFKISAIVYAFEQFSYAFLFKGNYIVPFIAAFFCGVGSGGFNVIISNYRYSIMPEDNTTNYETWFMMVHGLGIMLGPFLGNELRPILSPYLQMIGSFSEFQGVYFIASFLAVGSALIVLRKRVKRA